MEEWDLTDEELDRWLDEWTEVDRAAADYLAERLPEVREPLTTDEEHRLALVVETISPADAPDEEADIEGLASVAALQHADWLGLVLGVARRGAGAELAAEQVLQNIDRLDDVEGEIEDPEGTLAVLDMALLTLARPWQQLGILDPDDHVTEFGVWALPRAVHRTWVE